MVAKVYIHACQKLAAFVRPHFHLIPNRHLGCGYSMKTVCKGVTRWSAIHCLPLLCF